MGITLSHVKKRMAFVSGKNQPKNVIEISRNTKDGQTVSVKVGRTWAVFKVEDILLALAYVTHTDEQVRERLNESH